MTHPKRNGKPTFPISSPVTDFTPTPVKDPANPKSYFAKEARLVTLFSLCGIFFDGGLSVIPILQGRMIDSVVNRQGLPAVWRTTGLFLAAVVGIQALRVGKRFFVRRFANKTRATMRLMVYHDMIHHREGTETPGELLSRAIGDVDITVEGMRKCATEVFDTGLLLLSYLITLLLQSARITLLLLPWIALSLFLARRCDPIVAKASKQARSSLASLTNTACTLVEQMAMIRTTSREAATTASFDRNVAETGTASARASVLESSMEPLYRAVATIGIGAALYLGGIQVLDGVWTIGSYNAYLTLFLALAAKVGKVSRLFNAFQKASVSFSRVKPFLHPYQSEDTTIHQRLERPVTLDVRDLSFSYPGSARPTCSRVTFFAKEGQIVGITGAVASGKTTLGLLLSGQLPYQGSIRLGGRELSTLTPYEKAQAISYQGHQSHLLPESIRENITLGIPGSVDETLRDVCFGADLETMHLGADTLVGHDGARLSGGQASRINLARALWRHTPVIILDDPFASVDKTTEKGIFTALRSRYSTSLIFLISHRLSWFGETDLVLFLHPDGTIQASPHQVMLQTNETYRAMYTTQQEVTR
jgi:ABC-type multidrug transport system fused ATPase/permease subunit